jgi:methylenetetrahydrofolate dehydrogenase (NADP+) / methenyltetrahydrofolate cyclohydrolase
MPHLIDGKKIAAQVRDDVKVGVLKLTQTGQRAPGLAVVLVGSDPASQVYVRNKTKACETAGIHHRQINLEANIGQEALLAVIAELNADVAIDGILVQLPLPAHLDSSLVIRNIDPLKDVDGFHPTSMGRLVLGEKGFVPCTPLGVIEMLKSENIDLSGKNMVIVGRSNIVGKPMALLGLQANATVTVCHSKTKNLRELVAAADVIVAAIGRPKFITADMVKLGAVVIDVGINRCEDGSLCGDVDFESVQSKCSAITPVPGGVGPMTIAMLMFNTLQSRLAKNGNET